MYAVYSNLYPRVCTAAWSFPCTRCSLRVRKNFFLPYLRAAGDVYLDLPCLQHHCPQFGRFPYALKISILYLFNFTVWNLCAVSLDKHFVHQLRLYYDGYCTYWTANSKFRFCKHFQMFISIMGCSLDLLELRRDVLSGRTCQQRARKRLKCFQIYTKNLMLRCRRRCNQEQTKHIIELVI